MAIVMFLITLLSVAFHSSSSLAAAQQRQSSISPGSSLTPLLNSSWVSRSGLYAFGFYEQSGGYAVGIFIAGLPEKTVVWTANRDTNPIFPTNSTLTLKHEGMLVVDVSGQGGEVEINVGNASKPIASASMLDNGNFVLYDSDMNVTWQSFDHPTNTLLVGQSLLNGEELVSSASERDDSIGKFRIKMQSDGHLVQYPVQTSDTGDNAYWASGTAGTGSQIKLTLEDGGYLYLINSTINIIKNLTSGGYPKDKTIYIAKIDVDGIFRLDSHPIRGGNWTKRWSTTDDKCAPKGTCGINSFCTIMDAIPDCRCLPGFDFVSPGNWSSGCYRNSTTIGCQSPGKGVEYEMRTFENMGWLSNAYDVVKTQTKEGCEQACLDDCNCEVAQFRDDKCSKEHLPLKYGRRSVNDPNAVLVKVEVSDQADHLKETKKKLRIDILVVSISLLVLGVLALAISGLLVHKNRVWRYKNISATAGSGNGECFEHVGPRAFTYEEIKQATGDFSEEIGRGAFGTVFKGTIGENREPVAVKRLDKVSAAEGETEFQNEMRAIGKTHHRNLVKLLGYCIHSSERLLVYEYMSNGSLADILFTPPAEKQQQPCWEERIGIAKDVARGLLYLHEECETQIIHCDIKPQNILMNGQFVAKISDFGLAKFMKQDQTRTFTGIRGTRGYVAPEWHRKKAVTVKADVYSFGVVLMELITRRRSVDWSLTEDEAVLEEWVYNCFGNGDLGKLVRDEEVSRRAVERMVKISIWCIQDEPSLRPSMKKVLLMLEGTVDIPVPPSPTSFLSTT